MGTPLPTRLRIKLHPYLAWGLAHLFQTPLARPPPALADPRFWAREARPDELGLLARAFDRSAEQFEQRARKGHRCVCTFVDGTPIHMRWFSTSPTWIPEFAAYACPADGEVYTYDSHTDPAWRRRGAMALERRVMVQLLQREGYRAAWHYILAQNRASLAALRPESRRVFSVPFVRVGRAAPVLGAPLAHPLYAPAGQEQPAWLRRPA